MGSRICKLKANISKMLNRKTKPLLDEYGTDDEIVSINFPDPKKNISLNYSFLSKTANPQPVRKLPSLS